MKIALSLSLSLMISALCLGQHAAMDCSLFKTGKFSYFDSLNHTIFVTRKKHKQEEYNYQTNVKTVLNIKWITDCSYKITQTWSDSKAKRKFNGTYTIVSITKIIGDNEGYEYSCSCEDVNLQMKNKGIMRKEQD